jgi:hypothetical protein
MRVATDRWSLIGATTSPTHIFLESNTFDCSGLTHVVVSMNSVVLQDVCISKSLDISMCDTGETVPKRSMPDNVIFHSVFVPVTESCAIRATNGQHPNIRSTSPHMQRLRSQIVQR